MFSTMVKKQRFNSFRGQLGLSYALLVLVVTVLLTGMAEKTIANRTLRLEQENILHSVEGAAAAFSQALLGPSSDPYEAARQQGLVAGGRLIWLGPDQTVRVDGHRDPRLSGKFLSLPHGLMDDGQSQAEIYHVGDSWQAYAIAPLTVSERPAGYLLLIRDLSFLKLELNELRNRLWLAGGLLSLFFTLVGVMMANSFSKPVERLTKAVERMRSGELKQQVPVDGNFELASLAEAFNEMAASVAGLDEQRRNFIANAAHELRTPLAALQAMAEGMKEEASSSKQLEGFIRQIERLTRLVNNLLVLARLDNPQIKLNKVSFPVKMLLDESLWTIKPLAGHLDIVILTPEEAQSAWIEGDPDWLHQAVVNVLHNAVRHTPAGGTVMLAVTVGNGLVHLSIEDTGSGVDEEVLPFLGTRFYRPSTSRKSKTGGSGLGLAIVKEIVRLHHGQLSFTCPPGKGLRVTLSLPQASPTDLTTS